MGRASWWDDPPDEDGTTGDWSKHWTHDVPDGTTIEGLADSLIREAEAHAAVSAGSVWVRRGDGEWREVTAEELRERRAAGLD